MLLKKIIKEQERCIRELGKRKQEDRLTTNYINNYIKSKRNEHSN